MQYRVINPVNYNGQTFAPGAVVSLMEIEAAPLLASGLIERLDAEDQATNSTQARPAP